MVRVARSRDGEVTLAQIAGDFGIHEMTLSNWMGRADVEVGVRVDLDDLTPCQQVRAISGC